MNWLRYIKGIKTNNNGKEHSRLVGRKLNSSYITALFLGLTVLLSSCTEKDINDGNSEKIDPDMEKITFLMPEYEGGTAQFGSRAFDIQEEGYMSNLYIIAVKYKDYIYDKDGNFVEPKIVDPHKVFVFPLNPVGERFQLSNDKNGNGSYEFEEKDYRAFNVTLYPGEYRFGIVANVDLYLNRVTKISEFTQEADLDKIVLNFDETTPLAPPHLPMACLPNEIQYSTYNPEAQTYSEPKLVSSDNNYIVEIHKGASPRIYADMNFLCSKVRYTILFDKTPGGISEAFGNSWIRFNVDDQNRPYANYLRCQTQLFPGDVSNDIYDETDPIIHHFDDSEPSGRWTMNIGRYYWSGLELGTGEGTDKDAVYHGNEGNNYPVTPDSQLDEWDRTTSEWIPMEQKVWQGVVYLPENNGSTLPEDHGNSDIPKTVLNFPYHTRVNSLDETPEVEASQPKIITLFSDNDLKYEGTTNSGNYGNEANGTFTGLQRGYFYDVVAQVVNPDAEGMNIKVFVSIIQWHESNQFIQDNGGQTSDSDLENNGQINPWDYEGSSSEM